MTTSTVCLFARDEGAYLVEWLSHYVTLGFDRIVVYDNDSSDATARIVNACAEIEPRITLRNWPDRPGAFMQNSAYADALKNAVTEWIAFFDADELLVLSKHDTIQEFLGRYDDGAGAVAINWLMFGSSGETHYRDEPMARRFRLCGRNTMFKTIARVRHATKPLAHSVHLTGGCYFNDRGEQIELVSPAETSLPSYEFAQLNHYVVKSAEEYERKIKRGRPATGQFVKPPRDEDFWRRVNQIYNERENTAIDRWLARSEVLRNRFSTNLMQSNILVAANQK